LASWTLTVGVPGGEPGLRVLARVSITPPSARSLTLTPSPSDRSLLPLTDSNFSSAPACPPAPSYALIRRDFEWLRRLEFPPEITQMLNLRSLRPLALATLGRGG
jgi:hypothetical protein